MRRSPNGMYDLTGWTRINCRARESVYRGGVGLKPASGFSDPEHLMFTEWWTELNDAEWPILRDYRHNDERGCMHYIASSPEASREEGDDAQA